MSELDAVRKVAEGMDQGRLCTLLAEGGLLEKMAADLLPHLKALTETASQQGDAALEAKFAEGATFKLQYSGLSTFFGGLEKRIGAPDPNVDEAVKKEHVGEEDSNSKFTTSNYGITTTPKEEYYFVAQPGHLEAWPSETKGHERRHTITLDELKKRVAEQNEKLEKLEQTKLIEIEAIGGRLYTGPM